MKCEIMKMRDHLCRIMEMIFVKSTVWTPGVFRRCCNATPTLENERQITLSTLPLFALSLLMPDSISFLYCLNSAIPFFKSEHVATTMVMKALLLGRLTESRHHSKWLRLLTAVRDNSFWKPLAVRDNTSWKTTCNQRHLFLKATVSQGQLFLKATVSQGKLFLKATGSQGQLFLKATGSQTTLPESQCGLKSKGNGKEKHYLNL